MMKLLAIPSGLINEQSIARLQRAIVLILLLGSSHQLAQLTWQLIPADDLTLASPQNHDESTPVSNKQNAQQRLLNIRNAALFGIETPKSDTTASAPKSRLNVQLTGIMASSIANRSIAIIARDGKQQSYGVGDVIQGTDARITDIQPDRVIISRQQQQETLFLDENTSTVASAAPILKNPGLPTARQQILKNPGQLMDYLTIAPVRENNQLKGYRLNPGKSPELFTQIGLLPNDLAISINGLDLRNNSEAMQAMQQLAHQTEMNISVERNGETQDIYVNLAQP
jgi:general secretion pathway protein C